MGLVTRIALAVVIVTVDLVTFFVPLCALLIAWVILTRPQWPLEFIVKLYDGVNFGPAQPMPAGPTDAPPDDAARRTGAPRRVDEPPSPS